MSPKKEPAQFRTTILCTHNYLSPPAFTNPSKHAPKSSSNKTRIQQVKSKTTRCKQISEAHGCQEFGEVAACPVAVSPTAQKAAEYRRIRAGSDWALLDTLEVSMYNKEYDQRLQQKKESQEKQKAYLDRQIQEQAAAKQRLTKEKASDLEAIASEVAAFKAQQAQLLEKQKEALRELKRDREAQIKQIAETRAKAAARKTAEEKLEVLRAQREIERKEADLKQKKEHDIREMKLTLEENNRFTAAKQEALKLQAEKDEEMMKEMLAMLEKQEKEREASRQVFHQQVAAKSQSVGRQAITDGQNRRKKEEELLQKFHEQSEIKQLTKENETRERQMKLIKDLQASWEAQLSEKRLKEASLQKEISKHAEEVKRLDAAILREDAAQKQSTRNRNETHRKELEQQMKLDETRSLSEGCSMSSRERELNMALINKAKEAIQEPRILPLRPQPLAFRHGPVPRSATTPVL